MEYNLLYIFSLYSASNINLPKDIIINVKVRLFRFIWKSKRDKIKREGLYIYQDYEKGGLRMTAIETMIKAPRLAWLPRLTPYGYPNWKFVPDYIFKKYGDLHFLLSCNYDAKDFENVTSFYLRIFCFSFMN